MTRKFSFILLFAFSILFSFAQQAKLEVKVTRLDNGMKVVLCEDHSKSEIYGGVCVHAGSKNDPTNATGMAHYLEHMMFKGTDKIGTLDWKMEKPLIDQIAALYDQLSVSKDEKERKNILKNLNKLSAEAAQYAIPNEVDAILGQIGSTNVNAFTSNDFTVYHNIFPSGELEKWAVIYAERFRNPVFRLFQSELEAVYEEYNMYSDDPFSVYQEDVMAAYFKGHPYAVPVIGYPEHIKNPNMTMMYKFFHTYYVPRNMTLVLVGDFKIDHAMKILDKVWGRKANEKESPMELPVSKGKEIKRDNPFSAEPKDGMVKATDPKALKNTRPQKPVPFAAPKGEQIITTAQTPIKIGTLCFPSVPSNHPDALVLDICAEILSNGFSTGLCDKYVNDNKLYSFEAYNYSMADAGVFMMDYCPKMDGQTHEDAEKLIRESIQKLKKGDFNDNLFEAIKMNTLKDAQTSLENIYSKFYTVLSLEMEGKTAADYEKDLDRIAHLSKDELMKVAEKYFNEDVLIYRSNVGSKKTNTIEKPNWKPIPSQNTDKHSEFAKKLERYDSEPSKIQKIDFEKDVTILPVNNVFDLYASKNPCNDIFSLILTFEFGTIHDANLGNAVEYFNMLGTKDKSFEDFSLELQMMGADMYLTAFDNKLTISIDGFDKDFDKIMTLCAEKLYNPGDDKTKLNILLENNINNLQVMKEDGASMGRVLFNYALYGKNSPYLKRPSTEQIKNYKGEELVEIISKAIGNEGYVTYVGNQDPQVVAKSIQNKFKLFNTDTKKTKLSAANKTTTTSKMEAGKRNDKKQVRPVMNYLAPEILVLHNPKFIQSNIYFYIPSKTVDNENKVRAKLFNEYYNGGMNGVIFQNIRELRSLGYSAYGSFSYDFLNRRNAYMVGFLGTQSDKTIDGIEAMSELLKTFQLKEEKFETAKISLVKQYEAEHISFREIPEQVYKWSMEGYESDPRSTITTMTVNLRSNNIADFFNNYIGGRPIVITIAGNMNRIKKKQLSKYGNVTFLNYSDILNE
jgi:predicted Zn-dependent peptidase